MRLGKPEVVDAEPLGQILRDWIVAWLADRPDFSKVIDYVDHDHSVRTNERPFMGPLQYLSENSGINVRQVRRICNGETDQVSLEQADALLTAIGKNFMLSTGEIPVRRSKWWSVEEYADYMRERGCF